MSVKNHLRRRCNTLYTMLTSISTKFAPTEQSIIIYGCYQRFAPNGAFIALMQIGESPYIAAYFLFTNGATLVPSNSIAFINCSCDNLALSIWKVTLEIPPNASL